MAADFLMEAKTKPRTKTRIAARCGVNNNFCTLLTANGLLAESQRKCAVVTEKGNEFLRYFEALNKLFPKPEAVGAGA